MAGSNGTRMAGEELSKREQRERGRERIANDPDRAAARLEGVDRDKFDFDGYSDKDIIMAYQGGTFDKNDYARLTGNPLDNGGDKGGDEDGGDGGDGGGGTTPTPTPTPTPEPGDQVINPAPVAPPDPYGGSMVQNINQDNDISNNVSGDNNQIVNNQDNSISQSRGYSANHGSAWKDAWMTNYFA